MDLQIFSLVIAALAMIWGIYQTFVSHKLNHELSRLNVQLNERVKRLHRARELVGEEQRSHLFLRFYNSALGENEGDAEVRAVEYSRRSAAASELRGLAFAIGDNDLLALVNSSQEYTGNLTWDEMTIRGHAQKLYTRIAELLELETDQKKG